ncbi:MAG: DUF1592 domain-containing protein [Myxococcales bacterium]
MAAGSACSGSVGSPLGPGQPGDFGQGAAQGGSFINGGVDQALCAKDPPKPAASPNLVRLTHRQYDNTIRDLMGIESGVLTEFLADQVFYGFDNNAQNLSVPYNQTLRYRTAAERIAQQAAGDLSRFASSAPCVSKTQDTACRDVWLSGFLKRLFRRPLENAELTRYQGVFQQGASLYEDGSSFQRGVRLVLEVALQSPSFLYRAEVREPQEKDGMIPLSGHEVAARLSFLLWSSVPDDALLAKADADQLTSDAQVEAEVRRMLDDPKAQRTFEDFHAQWLELDKLRFDKDPLTFPSYNRDAFQSAARAETMAFVKYVGLESGGSLADLFTSPETFVNATTASVYGVSASGNGMTKVELDPSQRAGLLTQTNFLAGHADALNGSPIHRGAFIQKRLLCRVYGSLPANVGTLPDRGGDIVTTRDQVEAKTAPPQCQACHSTINPAGFAFEGFDTLGQARTMDHGEAVNTTGTLTIDGKDVSFANAVEFADALAASDTARRCYETQWFRYAMGRVESDQDDCALSGIDTRMRDKGEAIKEILVALSLSRGFRFRTQEDM